MLLMLFMLSCAYAFSPIFFVSVLFGCFGFNAFFLLTWWKKHVLPIFQSCLPGNTTETKQVRCCVALLDYVIVAHNLQ